MDRNERWAWPERWAEYFQKNEGIDITGEAIRMRIKKNEKDVVHKTARDFQNQLVKVYSEDCIRDLCADLLIELIQGDKDGFFIDKNCVRFGTIPAWAKSLKVSNPTVKSRIEAMAITPKKGRPLNNRPEDFYAEADVLRACADLINKYPEADKDGFFINEDGVRFGTIPAWAKLLNVGNARISRRLQKIGTISIEGKLLGNIWNFYSEADLREACTDLI